MRRIADPIDTAMTTIAGHRPRTRPGARGPETESPPADDAPAKPPALQVPLAPLTPPPLPDAAGTAFAVALAAGDLPSPKRSPEEVALRRGQSWSPPEPGLRLTDRKA